MNPFFSYGHDVNPPFVDIICVDRMVAREMCVRCIGEMLLESGGAHSAEKRLAEVLELFEVSLDEGSEHPALSDVWRLLVRTRLQCKK